MATEVILPRLGQGMESGTIVRWLKSEGEQVEKGEPLFELDTDKVTQEVEAEASGVLLRIAVAEGEVPVGETIAFIGAEGEEAPASAEKPAQAPEREPERVEGREAAAEVAERQEQPAAVTTNGRVKASPLARRIARERGVDLRALRGTGPEGRIVAEDVERAESAPALAPQPASDRLLQGGPVAAGEVERRPVTNVRRTIARRLTQAWEVPVFQLQASADMTRVNALVARLRERDPELRVTVTDVLTKVCATALVRHREVNAEWTDEAILLHPSANVGIAVAAPQGLVVPVIRSAERLTLTEITAIRSDVVGRARDNRLRAEDLEGGTFTISNLGMFAVESFTAVLNPPQAAIVAVGATEDRAVPAGGEVVVRPMVTLTATFDHRAVDGAPAAAFLQTVKEGLEEPGLAL
ncbi:MAG TPA: dihydrolipoamide acetyltransferase family protein [Gaiellaceae bacterium]|nr:dihydrolipoamide acetyltransferase family protein [Gaiellaceae bacterium]